MKILLPVLFILFVIGAGCSKSEPDNTVVPETAPPEINWFKGTIEEAFQASRDQNKPLFFYWGAIWCPPCNQLKATLFKRRDFIERTRLFIPVYLDGDTDRAQLYGDKFAVMGYPTLIIFASDGTEITRIPGGMELERYENVMQLALRQVRPAKALVEDIINDNGTITDDDCRLLAYYSWDQDNQRILAKGDAAETLFQLYRACPQSLAEEKSRLFIAHLHARLNENRDDEAEPILVADETFRNEAVEKLSNILSDRALVLANVYALRYENGDTVRALTAPGSEERINLIANWRRALDVISGTESLSQMERLGALYAEVSFNQLENDGGIDDALKAVIRQRVTHARASIENKYEHSAVINMVRNLLYHAEMYDYANQVISEEVNNAESPYFFMLELADLARKEGRIEDALNWLEKAYRESEPGATRFQWGVIYLSGVMEMTPDDGNKIQNLAVELIRNLGRNNDAFYNRNARRLERMSEELLEWNQSGQHNTAIFAIRDAMRALCTELEPGSVEYRRCGSFLVESPVNPDTEG